MPDNNIQTAQNVTITRNTASIIKRGAAFLIDILIYISYFTLTSLLLSFFDVRNTISLSMLSIIYSLPILLYHVLFEVFNNGQSIGKASLRIRVVKLDGSHPDLGSLMIRWLLRILDITLTTGGLAIVMILLNKNGQRLGDLAARTCVIDENPRTGAQNTLIAHLPEDHQPKYEQVRLFSDEDMQKTKRLFTNAEKTGNHKIKVALAQKLARKMKVEPEEKPHFFIQRVLADYTYYTSQDSI
jgi:uncharacterized RDD family membrane protein YckC